VACCRHHNDNLELHCSYNRLLRDSQFGIPLLFVEVDDKSYAIVLYLHPASNQKKIDSNESLKTTDVIVRCKIPIDQDDEEMNEECETNEENTNSSDVIQLICLDRLRSKCLMVHRNSDFYVFICGERTFKHLQ